MRPVRPDNYGGQAIIRVLGEAVDPERRPRWGRSSGLSGVAHAPVTRQVPTLTAVLRPRHGRAPACIALVSRPIAWPAVPCIWRVPFEALVRCRSCRHLRL